MVCFVPGCKSGHSSKEKTHLFKISRYATSEIRNRWIKNIPKRDGVDFDFDKSQLCHKHFKEEFVVKKNVVRLGSIIMAEEQLSRWRLADNAIPTIFSNDKVPKYFDKPLYIRPPPKPRLPLSEIKKNSSASCTNELTDMTKLQEFANTINMPVDWIKRTKEDHIEFSKMVSDDRHDLPTFHSEKRVLIFPLQSVTYIRKKRLELFTSPVKSPAEIASILKHLDELVVCQGNRNFNMFQTVESSYRCGNSWISDNCDQLVETPYSLLPVCLNCSSARVDLQKRATAELKERQPQPHKQSEGKWSKYKTQSRKFSRKIRSMKFQISSLRASLKTIQRQFVNLKTSTLEQAINNEENLHPHMRASLLAAANVAKAKSKHGVRYQSDWILQSLLLKICSPKAYRHLRDNKVLPLPNPTYLTSLLKGLPCQFGFNEFIFQNLKKEFINKPKRDRQFLLIFDEMKIRESISYDKSLMRFNGYIDYGEFTNEKKSSTRLEADHALVFMCRSMNSRLTQPIASFATRGSAPGNVLAKMILSCIVKLEEAGCEIIGVISDGATNNKSAWKALGISTEQTSVKNKIPNPVDESRSIHFFCDIVHCVKCIRNHIHKAGCVNFSGNIVNWGFYRAIYDLEKDVDTRIAYKLSYHHINPNPFQKMVVAFATQIFSKTVADAIRFYRDVANEMVLKYSEGTEIFTRKLNDLFDACNARTPTSAVRKDSSQYKVIKEFLRNLRTDDTFASAVTMTSIRVTLASTLDVIDYLCDEIGYDYVLTAKLNQDCLENFFGLLRSFGGDDCHPTASSFSHLFRLLSLYMPTAKSLRGNVSRDEDYSVVSYLDSLKNLKKLTKINSNKTKEDLDIQILSKIIYDECDSVDTVESPPSSLQAIVYHLCGYLVNKAKSFTKCGDCLSSLEDPNPVDSAALLTHIKDLGQLKYPSKSLFAIIYNNVEPKISEMLCKDELKLSVCVVSAIVSELDEIKCKGIGCTPNHSFPLVISLVKFYITIRMYFFSKHQSNEKLRSNSETKKKLKQAKLS